MTPLPSINIAKYRRLDDDMVQFVNFCVTHGTTGARNIGRLLRGKFLGRKIYQKNLYNVIQNAKKKLTPNINSDASDFLQHLYNLKTNNSRWFVEAKIDGPEHRLCCLIWLSPEQQYI